MSSPERLYALNTHCTLLVSKLRLGSRLGVGLLGLGLGLGIDIGLGPGLGFHETVDHPVIDSTTAGKATR